MKHLFKLTVATAAMAGAAQAQAQSATNDSGVYVNVGVTQLSADLDLSAIDVAGETVDLGNQSPDILMITGRIGYRFNDYISVEGDLGFGLGGDDFSEVIPVNTALGAVDIDADVSLDINNYFGAFVKGSLPLGDQFEVFARGGYGAAEAEADITASALGFTASASESETVDDFAFGVGAQYDFNRDNGLRFDYSSIGGDADLISLTYVRRF